MFFSALQFEYLCEEDPVQWDAKIEENACSANAQSAAHIRNVEEILQYIQDIAPKITGLSAEDTAEYPEVGCQHTPKLSSIVRIKQVDSDHFRAERRAFKGRGVNNIVVFEKMEWNYIIQALAHFKSEKLADAYHTFIFTRPWLFYDVIKILDK
jgi:hypothetical protein